MITPGTQSVSVLDRVDRILIWLDDSRFFRRHRRPPRYTVALSLLFAVTLIGVIVYGDTHGHSDWPPARFAGIFVLLLLNPVIFALDVSRTRMESAAHADRATPACTERRHGSGRKWRAAFRLLKVTETLMIVGFPILFFADFRGF